MSNLKQTFFCTFPLIKKFHTPFSHKIFWVICVKPMSWDNIPETILRFQDYHIYHLLCQVSMGALSVRVPQQREIKC